MSVTPEPNDTPKADADAATVENVTPTVEENVVLSDDLEEQLREGRITPDAMRTYKGV